MTNTGGGDRVRNMMHKTKTRIRHYWRGRVGLAAVMAAPLAMALAGPAQAEQIKNKVAVFAALDKVTGRISHLEVEIGQTVEFGAL